MTDDQINAAIAELYGWPANYTEDLNAMHEAENVLTKKQVRSYAFTLAQVLGTTPTVDLDDQFLNIHANARQRAEAFLRVMGKWEEVAK